MKTTITILATIFTLQAGILLAGNDDAGTRGETTSVSMASLAPVTPVEATFEDAVVMFGFAGLAPVTPAEATFEDVPADIIPDLAPLTPAAADFEDAADAVTIDLQSLAPVTPAEADFE